MNTISIHLTRFELLKGTLLIMSRNPIIYTVVLFCSAINTFPVPPEILALGTVTSSILTLIVLSWYALIFFLIYILGLWLYSAFIPSASRGNLGAHEFAIKENGLFEKTHVNETIFPYSEVRLVRAYKKGILILLRNRNGFWLPSTGSLPANEIFIFAKELASKVEQTRAR